MTQQEFLSRRQALLAQMQPGSAALIFAAPEAVRSADSEYPYRQNSDFWYFTGFNEPEALLVLIKSDETHNHSVLFNRRSRSDGGNLVWPPSGPGCRAG
ncbi:Xaa-Pro aminopeptidase [Klebsiella pneumoniae]|uniref:Xaa-Pro aminopeptidase n=1 Tax=Klebsiella pneumoniae TaxID=573 RepID=A0A378BR66_KLEPN|nr:Xaa-Pro aminopeptidase [Klebsiella pneumoniae]